MTTTTLIPELEDILAAKRHALNERKRKTPMEAIRALANMQKRPVPFLSTVTGGEALLLIGQVRYAPYEDEAPYDPVSQSLRYARGGLDGVALFTDGTIYDNGLDDLMFVTKAVQSQRLPVLTQDYIFDEYQVVEARAAGAAGLVLTTSVLDMRTLRLLVSATQRNRMTAIVHVSSQEELQDVVAISPPCIALSNYHPLTHEYDPDTPRRLRRYIPTHIRVAISGGIRTPERLLEAASLQPDALLISETLLAKTSGHALRQALNRPGIDAHLIDEIPEEKG